MLIGMLPTAPLHVKADEGVQFFGRKLCLGDDLTMHYYVAVDAAYKDSAVMEITVDGSTVGMQNIKNMNQEADGSYLFTVDLAAAQMTDKIMLTVTSGSTVLAQYTDTLQAYAHALLTGSYTDQTKALTMQLLNYGAKAQMYFGHNTHTLANAGYELNTQATVPPIETAAVVTGSVEGIRFYGASMVFESRHALRYYFSAPNGVEDYTFTVSNSSYKAAEKGDLYYIEVPGINPQQMDQTVELTVSDLDHNSLTVSYSPMHYITRMYHKQNTSQALKELLQALYGYYAAAKTYTGLTTHTVSFSDGVESQTVENGAFATEPTVSKDGYIFRGWYNGDTLFDFTQPITSDVCLTAVWKSYGADVWYDFGDNYSADADTAGAALTWLAEYEGAEGVLKLTDTADKPAGNTISGTYADIWSALPSTKILATETADSYADVRTDKIYVDAARNDYETAQIIVSSHTSSKLAMKVGVSELVHTNDPSAVIDSGNCSVYTQKYITVYHNQHGNGAPTGSYPDALLPQENAIQYGENTISARGTGGSWLSFYVPADAKPGTYTGVATVELGLETLTMDICLTVYDVQIPEETTSKSLFVINKNALSDYEHDSSEEMYQKYVQFLIDNRLAPASITANSSLAQDGDSDARIWARTAYDWYEKGLRTIPLRGSADVIEGYECFDNDILKDSALELAAISLEKGVNLLERTILWDYYLDEPFYVTYTAEHVQFNIDHFGEFVEETVAELSAMEGFDSALGKEIIQSVKEIPYIITDYYGNEFRICAPMVYDDGTPFSYEGQNVALCPKFDDYNTQQQRDQYDLLACEEKWWYGCNTPSYPYPSYHTDDTPVSASIIGWMMADYEVTGNLYWAINYFYKNGSTVSNPYALIDFGSGANGEGILCYPGSYYGVDGPVGTVKMSAILDGNEDYELIQYIKAEYAAQGLDFDPILEVLTSEIYDGTEVLGGSREFENARKLLLHIGQQMNAGVFYSSLATAAGSDGSRNYVFVVDGAGSDNDTLQLDSNGRIVGNFTGTASWVPVFEKEAYADAIALTFRMKVEGSAGVDMTVFGYDGAWKTYGKLLRDQTATNGWQEFTLYADVEAEYDALCNMFFSICAEPDAAVYMDDITVVYGCSATFSDGIAPQTVVRGSKIKKPADPIKPGHYFLGWYHGDTLFDFSQPITTDISLTAKWEAAPENMWYSFRDASCTSVSKSTDTTLTWLESFDGENGVLKIDKGSGSTEQWLGNSNGVNWQPEFGKEHYKNGSALCLRVQLVSELSSQNVVLIPRNWGTSSSSLLNYGMTANSGWQDIIIPYDVYENYQYLTGLFFYMSSSGAFTIYIDEITVVEEDPFMWYSFSDEAASTAIWVNSDRASLIWHESYDGEEGVLQINKTTANTESYVGSTNSTNWKAVFEQAHYEGAIGLSFRVKLVADKSTNVVAYGKNGSPKIDSLLNHGLTINGGWQDIVLPVDVYENYDALCGMYFYTSSSGAYSLYLDEITVVYNHTVNFSDGVEAQTVQTGSLATEPTVSKEGYYFLGWYNGDTKFDFTQPVTSDVTLTAKWVPVDMWYGFDDETCTEVWTSADVTLTWLDSFDGEDGVLRIDKGAAYVERYLGSTNAINWQAALDAEYYENAVALSFRIQLVSAQSAQVVALGKGWQLAGQSLLSNGMKPNVGWQDIVIPYDVYANYELLNGLFFYLSASGAFTLYIDQITVLYDYTVTFSDGVQSQKVAPGALATEPTVTREGYYFKGWYNGSVKYDFSQPVNAFLKLTAKWEQIPENMWYGFENEGCTDIVTPTDVTLTWHESYDGESGVLQIDKGAQYVERYLGKDNGINWAAEFDQVHYKNATALCFRVQLVSAQSAQVVALGKGWQLAGQSLLSNGMKPNVGWQDIVIPYDVYNDYELLNGLFYYLSSSGAFTLYIDEITVVTQ